MTPIEKLARSLADLDENMFHGLPYAARKVVYAAVEVEKAYRYYLIEESKQQKAIPFPYLTAMNCNIYNKDDPAHQGFSGTASQVIRDAMGCPIGKINDRGDFIEGDRDRYP